LFPLKTEEIKIIHHEKFQCNFHFIEVNSYQEQTHEQENTNKTIHQLKKATGFINKKIKPCYGEGKKAYLL